MFIVKQDVEEFDKMIQKIAPKATNKRPVAGETSPFQVSRNFFKKFPNFLTLNSEKKRSLGTLVVIMNKLTS